MSGATRNDSGWKSFPIASGQTVSPYRAIKGGTTNGVQHAGAGEGSSCIGFYQEDTDATDPTNIAVKLRNAPGTVLAEVSVAVSEGDPLYCAAAGKLTNVASGEMVAKAQEDGSGSGSIIEVLPAGFPGDTDAPFNVLPLSGDAITAAEFAASGLTLGMVAKDDYGNEYKLVKSDNVNGPDTLGYPMGVRAAGNSENDISDDLAASTEHLIRGLSANLFSGTDVYGWMMVRGSLETALNGAGMTVVTDGNVAQGDALYWATDGKLYGVVPTATMADHTFCGSAASADSGTNLTKGQFNGTALNSHGVA